MKISKHTEQRMKQRNISRGDVMLTIHTGVKMVNKHDDQKWTFKSKDRDLYVVTDKDMTVVITTFKGRSLTNYK